MITSENNSTLKHYYDLFKEIEKIIFEEKNIIEKINLIEILYDFMIFNHPGIFFSSIIENELITIAETIETSLSETFTKNSFLHVLTVGYPFGGHTQVVENWISAADPYQKHSIFFTNMDMKAISLNLKDVVLNKDGVVFYSKSHNPLEKAEQLRKISSEYEFVILHIHMSDPTAILAYGTKKFTRPVILYNHSQHTLWLGSSIVDVLLEITTSIIPFSKRRRDIKNNYYVGIPIKKNNYKDLSRNEAKIALNFPIDCKIILSIGSSYKYKEDTNVSFNCFVEELLNNTESNIIFIIIGIDLSNNEWIVLKNNYMKRLFLFSTMKYSDIYLYYSAADLYIDSFPVPGGISFLEALYRKINVITLESEFFDLDFKKGTAVPFNKLVSSAVELLNETNFIFNDQYEKLSMLDYTFWTKNTTKIIKEYAKSHNINNNSREDNKFEEYDYFWNNTSTNCIHSDILNLLELN